MDAGKARGMSVPGAVVVKEGRNDPLMGRAKGKVSLDCCMSANGRGVRKEAGVRGLEVSGQTQGFIYRADVQRGGTPLGNRQENWGVEIGRPGDCRGQRGGHRG